jgi:hypothetical protein
MKPSGPVKICNGIASVFNFVLLFVVVANTNVVSISSTNLNYIYADMYILILKKVKQSHFRLGQAHRVPRG